MTINQASEKFKRDLVNLINDGQLPISNIYYIFNLVAKEVESTYYATLNEECQEDEPERVNSTVDEEQMPEEIHSKEELLQKKEKENEA